MKTEKEQELWSIAVKRAHFKEHLATYIIINTAIWCIWYFTGTNEDADSFPWPAWNMLGWGIALAFEFVEVYISTDQDAMEKEYEKLKTTKE